MRKIVKIDYKLEKEDKIKIKKQLSARGKTIEEGSQDLGISISYLSKILNGYRNITPYVLSKFEKAGIKLNVNFEKEDKK